MGTFCFLFLWEAFPTFPKVFHDFSLLEEAAAAAAAAAARKKNTTNKSLRKRHIKI